MFFLKGSSSYVFNIYVKYKHEYCEHFVKVWNMAIYITLHAQIVNSSEILHKILLTSKDEILTLKTHKDKIYITIYCIMWNLAWFYVLYWKYMSQAYTISTIIWY